MGASTTIYTSAYGTIQTRQPESEAPDYREKIMLVYQEMTDIYNSGTEYQNAIVQELRELLGDIAS